MNKASWKVVRQSEGEEEEEETLFVNGIHNNVVCVQFSTIKQ